MLMWCLLCMRADAAWTRERVRERARECVQQSASWESLGGVRESRVHLRERWRRNSWAFVLLFERILDKWARIRMNLSQFIGNQPKILRTHRTHVNINRNPLLNFLFFHLGIPFVQTSARESGKRERRAHQHIQASAKKLWMNSTDQNTLDSVSSHFTIA